MLGSDGDLPGRFPGRKLTLPRPYLPYGHYGAQGAEYGYDFVCSVHRDHPCYAPVDIIEIVTFTDAERQAIRKARLKREAEWSAECRKRDQIDDENERRAAQGLPPLEGGWKR